MHSIVTLPSCDGDSQYIGVSTFMPGVFNKLTILDLYILILMQTIHNIYSRSNPLPKFTQYFTPKIGSMSN